MPVFFIVNEMVLEGYDPKTGKPYKNTMKLNGKNLETREYACIFKKTFGQKLQAKKRLRTFDEGFNKHNKEQQIPEIYSFQ